MTLLRHFSVIPRPKAERISFLLTFLLLLFAAPLGAQSQKVYQGFDGGMMLHTGYQYGTVAGQAVKGAPFGVGGAFRIHLGNHFRLGGEGYVSTLKQRGNGSHLKSGWGGVLADAYTVVGRFMPYAGFTIGGGSMTTLLMVEEPSSDWEPIDGTLYHRQPFLAVAPFAGFDILVAGPLHFTFKADWLCPIHKGSLLPHGPRFYFGILFYR
jgi:hypothetical protein